MCGRVLYSHDPHELADMLELVEPPPPIEHSYNLAPTDPIPIVASWGRLEVTRWGLTMQNPRATGFNAKVENLRRLYGDKRRVLVVVSGFYEWRKLLEAAGHAEALRPRGKGAIEKQPFLIQRADRAPLILAGVGDDDGVAILTAPATGLVATLHDRMPVVLERGDLRAWLDPSADVREILAAASSDALAMHPVSNDVGDVKNNHAGLIDPVPARPVRVETAAPQLSFWPGPGGKRT